MGSTSAKRPRSPDLPRFRWRPGQRERLEFDIYPLVADHHSYTDVLRDVHARTAPGDLDDVPWVSLAEAADYVAAAVSVLDHIVDNLAPGGTFWGQWSASRGWHVGWTPDQRRLHSRTLGDATLFLLRAAVAEREAGQLRPSWMDAVRSNLDVAHAGQRPDGALGAAHDAYTGVVLDYTGTAGLAVITTPGWRRRMRCPGIHRSPAMADPRTDPATDPSFRRVRDGRVGPTGKPAHHVHRCARSPGRGPAAGGLQAAATARMRETVES